MKLNAYKAMIQAGAQDMFENALQKQKMQIIKDFYETDRIMNLNVFSHGDTVYCYIESVDDTVSPKALFQDAAKFLVPLADLGGSLFRPMTEIFHFHAPQDAKNWHRKQKPDFCFGMIARLIPSMAARYIFYHYQLQEEQPGTGDKYSRIFMSDDIAFFYGEIPEVIEPVPYPGALSTHNTPDDAAWQNMMNEHFIPWETTLPKIDAKNYDWQKNGYPTNQRNNQWLYAKPILSIV